MYRSLAAMSASAAYVLFVVSHTMEAAARAAAAFPTRSAPVALVPFAVEMVMLVRVVLMFSGLSQVSISLA